MLTISFYLSIFSFSPVKFSVTDFLASMRASLQISYTPWEWPSILWDRKPRCWDLFLPSLSISHSSVIHREICVKEFSGTTVLRILKFGTNVGYDLLYCVKENQHAAAYHSLFVHFSFSPIKLFVTEFSTPITASLQIFYTPWEGPSILWDRKQNCFIMPYFSFFPFLTPM